MATITNQTIFEFQQHDVSKNANDGIVHPAALAMLYTLSLRPIGYITTGTGSVITHLGAFILGRSMALDSRAIAINERLIALNNLQQGRYRARCKWVALRIASKTLSKTGYVINRTGIATGLIGVAIFYTGNALSKVGGAIENLIFHRLFGL